MKTTSIKKELIDFIKNTNHSIIFQEPIEFFVVEGLNENNFTIKNSDGDKSKELGYDVFDDVINTDDGLYSDTLNKEFGVNTFWIDPCEELD